MEVPEILDAVDIVELASKFTDLTETNGEYWGLSPIKEEKTPSFSVRRETKSFYDFSSGVGGSAITLVQFCLRVTKHEAIEWLKRYLGYDPANDHGEHFEQRHLAITNSCKKYMTRTKNEKESKVKPLPNDYMDRFEFDKGKLKIWFDEGISYESMERFQVKYDGFLTQIVYPIRDIEGNIVNIGGRTLDPKWKEKGMKKYCYHYKWGTMSTIYGLAENMQDILSRKEIVLFEGCKSVMKADSWGIKNTGAILTSHLSKAQMQILAKLGCRVVFALDSDVDVYKDHNIEKLRHYVDVTVIRNINGLLDEKDSPVDKGKDVFLKLYEGRVRYN